MRFLLFPCFAAAAVVGFLLYRAGSDANARPALRPGPIGGTCRSGCVRGYTVERGVGGTPAYPG